MPILIGFADTTEAVETMSSHTIEPLPTVVCGIIILHAETIIHILDGKDMSILIIERTEAGNFLPARI